MKVHPTQVHPTETKGEPAVGTGGEEDVSVITAPQLKALIISGCSMIINNAEELNATNVFPIPDGDTGTNMASLGKSVIAEMGDVPGDAGVDVVLRHTAAACLQGGRGNSGTLLTFFWNAIATRAQGKSSLSVQEFATLIRLAGSDMGNSVPEPQEGTIITVARDSAADEAVQRAGATDTYSSSSKGNGGGGGGGGSEASLRGFFEAWHKAAVAALERTPDQLVVGGRHVLKEHFRGKTVTDSGAKGFTFMVAGMASAAAGSPVASKALAGEADCCSGDHDDVAGRLTGESSGVPRLSSMISEGLSLDDVGENRYCTECVFEVGESVTVDKLRDSMTPLGDSIVPICAMGRAPNTHMAKIHIHTNNPSSVFGAAARLALGKRLLKEKVEDMKAQVQCGMISNADMDKSNVQIITYTADGMPNYLRDRLGFIVMRPLIMVPPMDGQPERELVCGVELTDEEFVNVMSARDPHFQTAAPPVGEFVKSFKEGLGRKREVLFIPVSRSLSEGVHNNTFCARKYFSPEDSDRIFTWDPGGMAGLQALPAIRAHDLACRGLSAAQIIEHLSANRKNGGGFGCVPTLKYAIRGGRLKGGKAQIAKLLNVKPIISFDETTGAVKTVGSGKLCNAYRKAIHKSVYGLLPNAVDAAFSRMPDGLVSFMIYHCGRPDHFKWVEDFLEARYKGKIRRIFTAHVPSSSAVHIGPGGFQVGFYVEEK